MIIHRPHYYGGLGLHSVKYKALAGFITTFLQTAANSSFQPNLLHNLLYRKHVLLEDVPEAPVPPPPYLTQELFNIIRAVKESTSINIVKMTGINILQKIMLLNMKLSLAKVTSSPPELNCQVLLQTGHYAGLHVDKLEFHLTWPASCGS